MRFLKIKPLTFSVAVLSALLISTNDLTAQDTLAKYILTPKPGAAPKINGPKVFGVRPGHPIVFTIPASGTRPMDLSAKNLPAGVKVDVRTGKISGSISKPGEYVITIQAKNKVGTTTRPFKIVVGETIALTPPMGWNSWNIYGNKVTQAVVSANITAMASSGLINHGWSYLNIDDAWQGKRGGAFNAILPDSGTFPDMQGLA